MLFSFIVLAKKNIFKVAGSLAASAPVWQFSVDCGRFSNVTTSTFKKADPQCPTLISKSWDAINQLAKTEKGLLQLTDIFNLCEPLKNGDDLKSW